MWNKAGFVLNVTWISPYSKRVVRRDTFPTAQGRCIQGSDPRVRYRAVLSIADAEAANIVTRTLIIATGAALGAAVTGPAAIFTGSAAGGLIERSIPNPKAIFYVGVPSRDGRYLDVWGTIWSPQYGAGSRIVPAQGLGGAVRSQRGS